VSGSSSSEMNECDRKKVRVQERGRVEEKGYKKGRKLPTSESARGAPEGGPRRTGCLIGKWDRASKYPLKGQRRFEGGFKKK